MKKFLQLLALAAAVIRCAQAQQQCNPGTIACIDTLASNVAVVSVSGTYNFGDTCVWVCSGATVTLVNSPLGHGLNNVYVEANATVNISSSINGILAKAGATVNLLPGSAATLVNCEPGAIIKQNGNPWPGSCTCSEVIFDYTYAPAALECLSTAREQQPATPSIAIFPNPANESATIELNGFSAADEITVSNAHGVKIKSCIPSGRQLTIGTSSLSPGVYFITAISEGKKTGLNKLIIYR